MSLSEAKIIQFFKLADLNGDGSVTPLELCKAMRKVDPDMSVDIVSECFSEFDKDKNNKMTLEEMLRLFSQKDPESVKEPELKGLFLELDKNKSGFLTCDELETLIKKLGCKVDPKKILSKCDCNKDNQISFDEFLKAWKEGNKGNK